MKWLRQLWLRRRMQRELSEEIRQHLEEKTASLVAEVVSRTEAEYAAKRAFGNVTRIEERSWEVWEWPTVESTAADVKFAFRRLRRSPGFTATAVLTLALGIGANVVVFSVLNALILKPLDVPRPENLLQIASGKTGSSSQSYRDYVDYRDRDPSFSGMIAYGYLNAGFSVGTSADRSWGFVTSGNYFDVLGVPPALGRFFHSADERGPNSAPYIVLSYDFWHRQFNLDRQVLGKTVQLNHHPFTVIGISPKDFRGTDLLFWPDYWVPLMNEAQITGFDNLPYRDHYTYSVMGRLKPGVTPRQASESLNAVASQMAKEDKMDDGLSVRLIRPGPSGDSSDPTKNALLGIMLLAALVLLAACANLACLFAARAADRGGELAIRLAIGSSRTNIVRQLFTEAVMVSIAGGAVGTVVARTILEILSHWQPYGDFPTRFPIAPDASVYWVAIALALASGLLFGLLPARQAWGTDVIQVIKNGSLWTESFRRFTLRDLLLTVQIAVCTLLVTASLVAVRGMERSLHVPLGFQPQGITLARTDLRMGGYSSDQALPVQKRIEAAAAGIPGVTAVAIADSVPFQPGGAWFVYREGTTEFLPSHMIFAASTFVISPGYLKAAQTRLLAGREFTWHDDVHSPGVAIVNETFARKLFGDRSAIGQHFALWETAKYAVVGVVEDGKYGSITEEPQPTMFIPLAQGVGEIMSSSTTLLVRSTAPSEQTTAALHRILTEGIPQVPFTLRPWSDAIDLAMLPARAAAIVLGVMGLLAAMLAVTGIFGMASYSLSKRMKEHGIRIALGAQQIQVLRSALGDRCFCCSPGRSSVWG